MSPAQRARGPFRRPPDLNTVLGLGLVVWGVWIGVQPLADNSFLTHLATGRYILDELRVPTRDIYSFTAPDAPWVVQSWLATVAYAAAEDWFQSHGPLLLNGVLTGVLGGLVWRLARPAGTILPRFAVAALTVGVGTAMWVERPLLFGLVALAAVVVLTEDPRISPWVIVPVIWLWANSHGSWPLGLVFLAVRVGGTLLEEQRTPAPRERRLLELAALGTLLAAMNPIGPRLLWFPIMLVGDRADILENIVEWQAAPFRSVPHRLFLVGVLAAGALLTRRRGRWSDALVLLVFGGLAFTSARNIAVASVVIVPVLARGVRDLGTLKGDRRSPAMTGMAGAIVAVGALVVVSALDEPAIRLSSYPVTMLARMEVEANGHERVATQDFVGNLVGLMQAPGERAVFMDDRYDMWPEDVVDDYRALLGASPQWDQVLDDRDISAVVWAHDQPLASVIAASDDWHVVAGDGSWIIAERR